MYCFAYLGHFYQARSEFGWSQYFSFSLYIKLHDWKCCDNEELKKQGNFPVICSLISVIQ